MRSFVVVALAVVLFGCPPASERSTASDSGSPTANACLAGGAKVGDRCDFAPGKYGSCVHRDDCNVEPCLVCQSQH